MSTQKIQINGLEPSTPASPTFYSVQIRGFDAQGNPGAWSEWLTFQTAYQLDPNLNDLDPGDGEDGTAPIYEDGRFVFRFPDETIRPESITDTQISEGAIRTRHIEANQIFGNQIAARTITAANIAAETITANEIGANAITVNKISSGAITGVKFDSIVRSNTFGSTTGWEIRQDGSATFNNIFVRGNIQTLPGSSINASHITAGTLSVDRISANSISVNRLLTSTLSSSELNRILTGIAFTNGIVSSYFASNSVDRFKIIGLDAEKITAGTLSGQTYRTSAGSTRVQINGEGNTVQFWAGGSVSSQVIGGTSGRLLRMACDGTVDIVGSGTQFLVPRAYSALASTRLLYVNSNGLFGTAASSARFKENIHDLPYNYKNILNFRPVTFDWKETGEGDFGFIAEEVEKFSPELINYSYYDEDGKPVNFETDNYGVYSVKYEKLPILMLPILKDHDTIIQELQERISVLEERLGE